MGHLADSLMYVVAQTFAPLFTMPSADAYEVTAQIDTGPLTVITQSGTKLNATTPNVTHQMRLLIACKLNGHGCSASGPSTAFRFQGMDFEVALGVDR